MYSDNRHNNGIASEVRVNLGSTERFARNDSAFCVDPGAIKKIWWDYVPVYEHRIFIQNKCLYGHALDGCPKT
jgi:hypothetical protein